jgi:tetratricopeptide (TPR) repeat protein
MVHIFQRLRAWRDRRNAFRDIQAMQRNDDEYSLWEFRSELERAKMLVERNDHNQARKVWAEIRERFAIHVKATRDVLQLLLGLRLLDEADALLQAGVKLNPHDPFYLEGLARVAQDRGDLTSAIQRWSDFNKKFPSVLTGYSQRAACLVRLARFDEAESILARGIRIAPNDVPMREAHAKLAEAQGNWNLALTRWMTLRDMHDRSNIESYQLGALGVAKCLRKAGRLDEAEEQLTDSLMQARVHYVAQTELAGIAQDRGDWSEAARRWESVKTRFPLVPTGYLGYAAVLRRMGREAEVDAVFLEALGRFPDDWETARDYAVLAEIRQDFAEAARRWESMRNRFPDNEEAYRRGADALATLGETEQSEQLRAERQRRFAT